MADKQPTIYDVTINKFKNQWVVAVFMMIGIFVIGVASFTNAFKQITDEFGTAFSLTPDDIAGYWFIEETEKTPKTYIYFKAFGESFFGTTSILYDTFAVEAQGLKVTTSIYDARLDGEAIEFKTKRAYSVVRTNFNRAADGTTVEAKVIPRIIKAHYSGRVISDDIHFIMQVDGDYFEEVIAKRIDDEVAKDEMESEFDNLYE